MIPRKIAVRIWSAVLRDRAAVLTGRRRPAHRVRSAGQAGPARAELGRRMDAQADAIESWIDTDLCRGPDLPDDEVAQAAASLLQHGEAVAWVHEWCRVNGVPVADGDGPIPALRAMLEVR